jgi:hypothetical protein
MPRTIRDKQTGDDDPGLRRAETASSHVRLQHAVHTLSKSPLSHTQIPRKTGSHRPVRVNEPGSYRDTHRAETCARNSQGDVELLLHV